MTPEISRRCRACGASAREGGRFCPQCGERLDAAASSGGSDAAGASAPEASKLTTTPAPPASPRPTAPEEFSGAFRRPGAHATPAPEEAKKVKVEEVRGAFVEFNKGETAGDAPVKNAPAKDELAATVVEPPPAATPPVDARRTAAAEGAKGRRASAVRESLRPRVERVRDASMGVIEEASEDTGLRFVLISLVIFLLFLLLLLLNSLLK